MESSERNPQHECNPSSKKKLIFDINNKTTTNPNEIYSQWI